MHLLQNAPLGFYIRYGVGVIPFILALLFFWSDLSTSAFAAQYVLPASVGMALVFLWMKVWQALACYRLRCLLYAVSPAPWRLSGLLGLIARQTAWQPTGFLILPLALLLTLPFAACYAFYQNLTILEEPGNESIKEAPVAQRAWDAARPWPQQGFKLLGIFSLLAFIVMLNLLTLFLLVPSLAKSVLGVDTPLAQNPMLVLNSTVLMCILLGSYFVIDVLAKAVYLVRVYEREALRNGQDLRAAWRRLQERNALAVTVLLAVTACALVTPSSPAAEDAPSAMPEVSAFDEAAERVLKERRYVWRQSREPSESLEPVEIPAWLSTVWDWLERFINWLLGNDQGSEIPGNSSIGFSPNLTRLAVTLLIVLTAAVFIYQFFRRRDKDEETVIEVNETGGEAPDLSAEEVAADALASSEWTRWGAQLLAEGNYRLALRAYHLAVLSHLTDRHIISYAKHKSNRDYIDEVQRRAHAYPDIVEPFGQSVRLFERTWYGRHLATESDVQSLKNQYQKIHQGYQEPALTTS